MTRTQTLTPISFLMVHRITSYNVCYTKLLRSFEISDSSNLAGNAIGIVSNEATATNHIFSVYEANFNLKTEQGSFVDYMDVAIDNVTASTNYNTGMATIKLFNGTYTYRIANNTRITSYNVCYTKLLRIKKAASLRARS